MNGGLIKSNGGSSASTYCVSSKPNIPSGKSVYQDTDSDGFKVYYLVG